MNSRIESKKVISLLYITYIDFDDINSGSSVRPQKMYDAFVELGYDVKLLNGSQGNCKRKERKKRVRQIIRWLDSNKPDFCYVESSTYPILMHCDYKLLKKINSMKIPSGYFYRDFYRKFPDLFLKRKGFINCIKELYLDYMQWKTDRLLNKMDIVYLPSEEAKRLLSFNDMRALPPAGEDKLFYNKKPNHTCIYVGGISKYYGFDFLIESFKILHNKDSRYKLILICRQNEWDNVNEIDKKYPWMEVHHVAGSSLEKFYREASIAVMPKLVNEYNNIAVSVKLYEYMEYGLPIVALSNKAMKLIIEEDGIGLVANQEPVEFANAIESIMNQEDKYRAMQNNIKESLLSKNLWKHRAKSISNDLIDVDDF